MQRGEKTNIISLDKKDRKILACLCKDGRMPVSQISRQVGLSRDAVQNRLDNYEETFILGYLPVTYQYAGKQNFHVLIRHVALTPEELAQALEAISTLEAVRSVISFTGEYLLELAILVRNHIHLETVISDISRALKTDIRYEVLPVTRVLYSRIFPSSFIKQDADKTQLQPYDIDDLDKAILGQLQEHGRKTYSQLSLALDTTAMTVARRVRKMKKAGFLSRIIPVIDYAQLGYTVHLILMNVSQESKEAKRKCSELLTQDEHIVWAAASVGKYNIAAYHCAQDSRALHETLRTLYHHLEGIVEHTVLVANKQTQFRYVTNELLETEDATTSKNS